MALFKISKGASGGLNNQTLVDGYCWFTYDDGKFYIDYKDPSDNAVKRKALNADRADKDASGNIINTTYLPLTGGTLNGNLQLTGELNVTGNAYLHNQTTADSLTAGSLLVTGIISGRLNHTIKIGNYEYDGSSDITIPIYNGATS